jgi:PadR family transcriptional regulator AphA
MPTGAHYVSHVADTDLSLADWVVLGIVGEGPTHGWPIVRELRGDGALGQIWTVARPVVYRSINTLTTRGYVEAAGEVPGLRGPQRTIVHITTPGRRALRNWLRTPVAHVRDIRTELLIKLALLSRSGLPTHELVDRQLEVLEPIVRGLSEPVEADGFARIVASWRREQTAAVERFLRSPDVRM